MPFPIKRIKHIVHKFFLSPNVSLAILIFQLIIIPMILLPKYLEKNFYSPLIIHDEIPKDAVESDNFFYLKERFSVSQIYYQYSKMDQKFISFQKIQGKDIYAQIIWLIFIIFKVLSMVVKQNIFFKLDILILDSCYSGSQIILSSTKLLINLQQQNELSPNILDELFMLEFYNKFLEIIVVFGYPFSVLEFLNRLFHRGYLNSFCIAMYRALRGLLYWLFLLIPTYVCCSFVLFLYQLYSNIFFFQNGYLESFTSSHLKQYIYYTSKDYFNEQKNSQFVYPQNKLAMVVLTIVQYFLEFYFMAYFIVLLYKAFEFQDNFVTEQDELIQDEIQTTQKFFLNFMTKINEYFYKQTKYQQEEQISCKTLIFIKSQKSTEYQFNENIDKKRLIFFETSNSAFNFLKYYLNFIKKPYTNTNPDNLRIIIDIQIKQDKYEFQEFLQDFITLDTKIPILCKNQVKDFQSLYFDLKKLYQNIYVTENDDVIDKYMDMKSSFKQWKESYINFD